MHLKTLALASSLCFVLIACDNKQDLISGTDVVQDSVAVKKLANGLEEKYVATFEGILPCGDCEGIKTVLDIKADNTFTLVEQFLGSKNYKDEHNSGTYSLMKDNVIKFEAKNRVFHYKMIDGTLLMVNEDGENNNKMLYEDYTLRVQK